MVIVAFLPHELLQVGTEEYPSCSELPAKLPLGSHPQVLYVLSVNSRVHGIYTVLCFFFRISSYHIVNSVCCSHVLVNCSTSKRPVLDCGLLCSGQLLMMWSAICSGSPHSHAALSASPHFFMEALYRPTPVRSLFRVVHCFRLRSSPLTPSPADAR